MHEVFVVDNDWKCEHNQFFEVWMIIVLKDLSAVYCESPPSYNKNFSSGTEDFRTSKQALSWVKIPRTVERRD